MNLIHLWSSKKTRQNRFEELLAPHIGHLYKLAYRFQGNQVDAEDLVQDLLVKLYPQVQEISRVENLKPWLSKILYHLFIDQKRKQSRSPVDLATEDMDTHNESLPDLPISSNKPQEDERYIEQIDHAMTKLNPDQRSLIIFHDVEGYTLAELEKMLDTPIGTLKSRLNRSRKKLRDFLMEPNPEVQRFKHMRG